jgi:hypothetical protein
VPEPVQRRLAQHGFREAAARRGPDQQLLRLDGRLRVQLNVDLHAARQRHVGLQPIAPRGPIDRGRGPQPPHLDTAVAREGAHLRHEAGQDARGEDRQRLGGRLFAAMKGGFIARQIPLAQEPGAHHAGLHLVAPLADGHGRQLEAHGDGSRQGRSPRGAVVGPRRLLVDRHACSP